MNSNDNHMSASQRRILALEQQIAVLQQMQKEYNVVLNYLVIYHGSHVPDNLEENREFVIFSDWVKSMKVLPIRTEIVQDNPHGSKMIITRVHDTQEDNKPQIIVL